MAYVIVTHKNEELARRPLDGPLTLGRSPECDLSVHDILLSRRHCRIEPDGDECVCVDLGSKNGTRIAGTPVFRLPLQNGDVICIGKTTVRFFSGPLPVDPSPKAPTVVRPADPFEALAGTVSDFVFAPAEPPAHAIRLPTPKPVPREPVAYARDDVRTLVSELVSSSWDSIYETARRPESVSPDVEAAPALRRKRPHEPRIDLSLQVHPEPSDFISPESDLAGDPLEAYLSSLDPCDCGEPLAPETGEADWIDWAVLTPGLPAAAAPQAGELARGTAPVSSAARPAPRRKFRFLLRRLAMLFQWLPLLLLLRSR